MNSIYKILFGFSLLVLNMSDIDSLFVEVGEYPEFYDKDINLKECGLRYPPKIIGLAFNSHCFKNVYQNKTIYDIRGIRLHRKVDYVSPRLWGGQIANERQAPWAVYISLAKILGSKSTCEGVLITFEWVLTSGRCNIHRFTAQVWAGSREKYQGLFRFADLNHWYRAPGWILGEDVNDLGLFKLHEPFVRHQMEKKKFKINTICLPMEGQTNNETEEAIYYAWGVVSEKEVLSNWLKRITVTLKPSYTCGEKNTLCADFINSDDTSRPCPLDFGAGLVQYNDLYETRAILVGILGGNASLNTQKTCQNTFYHQWTQVSRHIEWILSTIKAN